MKIDKWFLIILLALEVLVILDLSFTYYGISLGFSEGNPLMEKLFNEFGVRITCIVSLITVTLAIILLMWIRNKIEDEEKIRRAYCFVSLLLCIKAFVVGSWLGMLVTKINGGAF